jgi:hypothetical protein
MSTIQGREIDLYGDFIPTSTAAGEFVLTRRATKQVVLCLPLAGAEQFLWDAIEAFCAAHEITAANSAAYQKRRAAEAAASTAPKPPKPKAKR